MKRAALFAVLVVAACDRAASTDREPSPSAPADRAPSSPADTTARMIDLAHDLSVLATGITARPDDLDQLARAGFTRDAFASYVAQLLKRPEAGGRGFDVLSLGGGERGLWPVATLKTKTEGGTTIYYLHAPCELARTETVHPWWDLNASVRVCADAHRPTVFQNKDGAYCDGTIASPKRVDSPCGCGPNLIRCVKSDDELAAWTTAIEDETFDTIAYIIDKDLPLETVFRSQESYRSGLAELMYQRWLVEDRKVKSLAELPDWRKWPKAGKWAARPEAVRGEHAGVLTNLFVPQARDSQRTRLYLAYQMMWCSTDDSLRVSTAAVLELGKHIGQNLRDNVVPNELATREGCGSCHARIDYGVQFFAGDQWSHKVDHYISAAQLDTPGPLYNRDINDPRGAAPRNPAGFANLALAQPEFPACMSRRFIEHVFGRFDDELVDLDGELRKLVSAKASYRKLLTLTLERYLDRELPRRQGRASPATDAKGSALAALTETRCGDCHDASEPTPIGRLLAGGEAWCKSASATCTSDAIELMNVVAFATMPKNTPMPRTERAQLLARFADTGYADPTARQAALAHFSGALDAESTHRFGAVLARIRLATGTDKIKMARPQSQGPHSVTLGAASAVAAIKACRGKPDEAACITNALEIPGLYYR
ncbi:MAG TPA: hypothetical protein VM513_34615 [Kofleriaceae bacterium]|nr:hypothetical protein [Kofleriaceae bacterium]